MRSFKIPTIKGSWFALELPKSAVLPAVLVAVLGAFGQVLISSTHLFLVEQYVCREYYTLLELSTRNGGVGEFVEEALCKVPEIQSMVADIMGTYSSLSFLPSLLLTGTWGNLAKVLGKKVVIFVNACCLVLQACYFTAVCYNYDMFDIRWIWVTPFFEIFGGGQVILSSLVYTYIAESVDAKILSSVLYKFSAIQLLMAFLSMSFSSYMLRIDVWILCFCGILTLIVLIPVTLLFPSSTYTPAGQYHHRNPSLSTCGDRTSVESTSLLPDDSKPQTMFSTILQTLFSSFKHSINLFKDIINSSPLSRVTLLTFFLLTLTNGIRVIFTQWASITYHWSIASVTLLTSFELILTSLIFLSLPLISTFLARNHCTATTDILLTKGSLIFSVFGLAFMATAPSRETYVASVTVYTMGNGARDSLRSFSTGLLGGDVGGVEKLYLGIGLVETLGNMVASVGWMGVYARVLGGGWWLERLPFWGVLGVMGGLAWVVVRLGRMGMMGGRDVVFDSV